MCPCGVPHRLATTEIRSASPEKNCALSDSTPFSLMASPSLPLTLPRHPFTTTCSLWSHMAFWPCWLFFMLDCLGFLGAPINSVSYLCCPSVTVVSLPSRKIWQCSKRQATNFVFINVLNHFTRVESEAPSTFRF